MINLEAYSHRGEDLHFTNNKFSGGEVNIRLHKDFMKYITLEDSVIIIKARLNSSDVFFELAMLVDAIRIIDKNALICLYITYIPYARQDRVCNDGEALSSKVYANLINSLGCYSVTITDPHSDVITACIDNCDGVKQENIITGYSKELHDKLVDDKYVIVSPDAGSNKKITSFCKKFNIDSFVRADKTRNVQTGRITKTVVHCAPVEVAGKDCLIVDDLCDSGYTFTQLANELRYKGAKTVSLYVTHGIFSKGLGLLLDNGIDHIYTTNSFKDQEEHEKLTEIKLKII